MNFAKLLKQRAFSLLPVVLITGIIVAEVGVALSFIMYLTNSASYGARLSQEAFYGARSGINDAFLKVIRNKDFYSPGYNFTVGKANVNVVVTQTGGGVTITSTGTVLNRQRKLQAVISIDADTGEAALFSLQEL
ncbi:MAG TPA: hypothetical protein PLB74_00435 [Candidatus Paceibacterota bacterium]|nr:hypothetical protein [Candidatus Paceibacterota bacterium]